jgi:hypothetical protein
MNIPKRLNFISKKRFFIPAIVIIMTTGFFLTRGGNSGDQYETATVSRGLFTQAVAVSGKVNPKDKVSLSFEQGGRVASLSVNTGNLFMADTVVDKAINPIEILFVYLGLGFFYSFGCLANKGLRVVHVRSARNSGITCKDGVLGHLLQHSPDFLKSPGISLISPLIIGVLGVFVLVT